MQYSCSYSFFSLALFASPILVSIGNKRNSVIRKSLSGGRCLLMKLLFSLQFYRWLMCKRHDKIRLPSIWRTQSWLEYRLSGSPIKSGMLLHRRKPWKWMAMAILCRWNICLNHLKIKFDRNSFGNCGAVCVCACKHIYFFRGSQVCSIHCDGLMERGGGAERWNGNCK